MTEWHCESVTGEIAKHTKSAEMKESNTASSTFTPANPIQKITSATSTQLWQCGRARRGSETGGGA